MRCDNVDRGCTWTGTVGTVEDHVDECGYTMVQCSKKCKVEGNDFSLMRKDLKNHLTTECPNRAHKCEYCGEEGTYASITEEHDQLCLKKPIPCTECTLTTERGRVEKHVASECMHTIVACQYSNIGCTQREKRKDIKTHEEDDKVHLHLSLKKIVHLDNAVKEMSDKLNGKKCLTIDVKGFTKKQQANEMTFSEQFFTVPNGYKMTLEVFANGCGDRRGTHVSVFTRLLDVPYNDLLRWPFRGTVTFELLNQLADDKHKKRVTKYIDNLSARPGGRGWGCSNFIRHSELHHNPATNTQYLADDDILHFRLTVQENNDRPWLH